MHSTMKEKLEYILKLIQAISLVCYFCGFVIYKSFLFQYGIIETDIINVRFLEAGILYLVIAPFIIATQYITNRKLGYLGSVFTSLFAFMMYNNLVGTFDLNYTWKAYLIVIGLSSWAFLIWGINSSETKKKLFDLTESPLFFFILIIASLTLFSTYFKEIKPNLGGGKSYSKVLILKERHDNLIKTDSLMRTDTLNIIYENKNFVYYIDKKVAKSINKEFIGGEIYIK